MGFLAPVFALGAAGAGAGGLGIASLALGGAGTILSTIGSIEKGQSAASADRYAGAVAENNAIIARNNATAATQAGDVAVQQQQLKTRAEVGEMKATQGAGNIDVNSGSAVDVRSSAASLGELNALTIRNNAARQAYGYRTEATSFESESQMKDKAASEDETAGWIGGVTSLLSGASSLGSEWSKFQYEGVLGGGGTSYDPTTGQG